MNRTVNRSAQFVLDAVVLSLALWASFFLRFDGMPPMLMFKRLVFVWPWVVCLQFTILVALGVHRFSWRLIGLRDITRIFGAIGLANAVLFLVRLSAAQLVTVSGYFEYSLIPIGVLIIDLVLAFVGIAGIRALRRIWAEHSQTRSRADQAPNKVPTLLIGAGQAGLLVAKELAARPELGIKPVGFIDDDKRKVGTLVHGIPVLGTTESLRTIARSKEVKNALITIAHARGADIRRIGQLCQSHGLTAKIVPGVHEIVGGQVNVGQIRELAIEDLLRRDPVSLEEDTLENALAGKVVVVTGAGGSIGSELCVQICRFKPTRLIMIERTENVLFEAHRRLVKDFPDVELVPCIADVTDTSRIERIFNDHRPEAVFHAAAHKHVPMMEANPGEAIKNNVVGTKRLADVAHAAGVQAFVMVSTDKAVNPTSVMGASKRIAEMYIQALSSRSKTRFVTVRFGNVLGSAGSVIPIFKQQIAAGGPVTVTHPAMTRYFMTIPEACQLVLQAGAMGQGGEIFILDMGDPVRIVDLAEDLISLSGFEPNVDIEISFTGIRPGEKLYEELSVDSELAKKTRHPKIYVGNHVEQPMAYIEEQLVQLAAAADRSGELVRERMRLLVPEYLSPTDAPTAPKQPIQPLPSKTPALAAEMR